MDVILRTPFVASSISFVNSNILNCVKNLIGIGRWHISCLAIALGGKIMPSAMGARVDFFSISCLFGLYLD